MLKFRWWYVSMGITIALVLVETSYFAKFLCVPVENLPCASFLSSPREIVEPPTAKSAHVIPSVVTNPTNSSVTQK
jgi:hypothetical protein